MSRQHRIRKLEDILKPGVLKSYRGRKVVSKDEWWKVYRENHMRAFDTFPDTFTPAYFDEAEVPAGWMSDLHELMWEKRDPIYGMKLCDSCLVYQVQRAEDSTKRFPFPSFEWAQHLQVEYEKLGEEIERSLPEAKKGCRTFNVWSCPYGEENGFELINAGQKFKVAWTEQLEPELRREQRRRAENRLCLVCASPDIVLDACGFWCAEHAASPKQYWNIEPYRFYGIGAHGEFLTEEEANELKASRQGLNVSGRERTGLSTR